MVQKYILQIKYINSNTLYWEPQHDSNILNIKWILKLIVCDCCVLVSVMDITFTYPRYNPSMSHVFKNHSVTDNIHCYPRQRTKHDLVLVARVNWFTIGSSEGGHGCVAFSTSRIIERHALKWRTKRELAKGIQEVNRI